MKDKNYEEEIEILDGLEDLFPETSEKKEQPKEAPEEILSVLNEPTVNSFPEVESREEEKIVSTEEPEEVLSVLSEEKEEIPFTTFTPDTLKEEKEEEIPSSIEPLNEPEEIAPVEEENSLPLDDSLNLTSISDFKDDESLRETDVEELPVQEEEAKSLDEPQDMYPDVKIGPSDLEPVDITPVKQEVEEEPTFDHLDTNEPTSTEPIYDLNYNFVDDFTNGGGTLDDAFQFEPVVESLEKEEPQVDPFEVEETSSLDKTVIIEPVEPKQASLEPVVQEPEVKEVSVEEKQEVKEEKPEKIKQKKEKEKGKNGRTIIFIILLVILLLAFAVLVPMVLEKFAV